MIAQTYKYSLALIIAFASTLSLQAQEFNVDKAHSATAFSISHLSISKVRGRFKTFDGKWTLDPNTQKITALELDIDIASVDTDNADRDDHLRKEDFFDAKKHPKMVFRMAKYVETSPGKGKIIGTLTMRGKAQPIQLQAEVSKVVDNPWKKGKKKHGLSLTGTVKRLNFGIGEKYGDAKIGEDVAITVDLEGDN